MKLRNCNLFLWKFAFYEENYQLPLTFKERLDVRDQTDQFGICENKMIKFTLFSNNFIEKQVFGFRIHTLRMHAMNITLKMLYFNKLQQ